MKELIILIGNIGTGKSTFAKNLQKAKNYVVISRDSLRYGIGAGNYIFNLDYEEIIWNTELFMFRNFVNKSVSIVIDEVGVNKKLRKRYIPYAKANNYFVQGVILPKLSMKEAVDRRMNDPHGQYDRNLWEEVWTKFNEMYEEPIMEEGFDRIVDLSKYKGDINE